VLGGHGRGATFGAESRSNGRPQPRGGKCAKTYSGHTNAKYCVFAAFLSANSNRQCVVSGSEDGMVYLYDLQSRLIRQTLKGHNDAVLAVDAHQSLEFIGSGGMTKDKCVRFWSTSTVES
jgi:COMPASS component SWD3